MTWVGSVWQSVVQEAGVQAQPQKFYLVKIRAKSLKILAKFVKTFAKSLTIWANSLKIHAKWRPIALIWKHGAQRALVEKKMAPKITWRPFFGGHPKYSLHEKIFAQKVAQNVFGQVWRNSGKNLFASPKIFPLLHLCCVTTWNIVLNVKSRALCLPCK